MRREDSRIVRARNAVFRTCAAIACASVLGGAGLAGCGKSPPASTHDPIVFVGIDSADWTWIDALIQQGRMPNMAELERRGTRANLLSLVPAQKSPTIWTSIATGKRPAKHGIAGFLAREGGVERSIHRTAATYWEILGALGHRQAVIGWWVTYPAEAIDGVLVSDYVQYFRADDSKIEGAVYPPELWETIEPLRVRPESLTLDDLGRFIDVGVAQAHAEDAEKLLSDLRWIYAGDQTFRAIARELYKPGAFDVFTVYFRGLDAVCHSYWKYFKPKSSHLSPEPWAVQMLGDLIPRYHDYVDELLGEILAYVQPESRVIVCSDHGFEGFKETRQGLSLGIGMHRDHGILVMAGRDIRRDAVLESAEVKDIMPTLLLMAGLPPAHDLDGHVLLDAFEPGFRRWGEHVLTQEVDSYEGLVSRQDANAEEDTEVDAEVLQRLRALGYID
jgi:predicted AlkP superfamily phosphohydrolase/phosphomutase